MSHESWTWSSWNPIQMYRLLQTLQSYRNQIYGIFWPIIFFYIMTPDSLSTENRVSAVAPQIQKWTSNWRVPAATIWNVQGGDRDEITNSKNICSKLCNPARLWFFLGCSITCLLLDVYQLPVVCLPFLSVVALFIVPTFFYFISWLCASRVTDSRLDNWYIIESYNHIS